MHENTDKLLPYSHLIIYAHHLSTHSPLINIARSYATNNQSHHLSTHSQTPRIFKNPSTRLYYPPQFMNHKIITSFISSVHSYSKINRWGLIRCVIKQILERGKLLRFKKITWEKTLGNIIHKVDVCMYV